MAEVLRIPVAGPDPFNTLAVVREPSNMTGLGSVLSASFRTGGENQATLVFKTSFVLIGYDPRLPPPPFKHSTTVVMRSIQLGHDTTFTMALDTIDKAGFDDEGRWIVSANSTVRYAPPGFFHPINFVQVQPYLSSWVLCYEPPLDRSATVGGAHSRVFTPLAEEHSSRTG